MELELKALREGFGHDNAGWDASLYVDGKRTAICTDDGWGGEIHFEVLDQARFEAAEEAATKLPPDTAYEIELPMSIQLLTDDLRMLYRARMAAKRRRVILQTQLQYATFGVRRMPQTEAEWDELEKEILNHAIRRHNSDLATGKLIRKFTMTI